MKEIRTGIVYTRVSDRYSFRLYTGRVYIWHGDIVVDIISHNLTLNKLNEVVASRCNVSLGIMKIKDLIENCEISEALNPVPDTNIKPQGE